MKKRYIIILVLLLTLAGLFAIYKIEGGGLPDFASGQLRLRSVKGVTQEQIKSKVDEEIIKGRVSNFSDLELMAAMYPENESYTKMLFEKYYDEDPNLGLIYAGENYKKNGNVSGLELASEKLSTDLNYTEDLRYDTLMDLLESAANNVMTNIDAILYKNYRNEGAVSYIEDAVQVELMLPVADPDHLYLMTYGQTPFQDSISQGEQVTKNQSVIYKINKNGEISHVTTLNNEEDQEREILFLEDAGSLAFVKSDSLVNFEDQIAFIGRSEYQISNENKRIVDILESQSIKFDWSAYPNLTPNDKAYIEVLFKHRDSAQPNINSNGAKEPVIRKSYLYDLDKDGTDEFILLVNDVDELGRKLSVYIYTFRDDKAVKIFSYKEATESTEYKLGMDIGILEGPTNSQVYISSFANSGFMASTNIGLLYKEMGEDKVYQKEAYTNLAYLSYLSADGETNEYSICNFVGDPGLIKQDGNKDPKSGYYELRDKVYGEDSKLFITDVREKSDKNLPPEDTSWITNYENPKVDELGNIIYPNYNKWMLNEKEMTSLLLIPFQKYVDRPLVRRFRVGDMIFPPDVLKIREDSTGHINSSIFKEDENFELVKNEESDSITLKIHGNEWEIKNPYIDEGNNYYIPFSFLKNQGMVVADTGYLVDLSLTGAKDKLTQTLTIEELKARVDKEIANGQLDSINDLELILTIYDTEEYRFELLKKYYAEYPNKAYLFAKQSFERYGNPEFLKYIDEKKVEKFIEGSEEVDLDKYFHVPEENRIYLDKIKSLLEEDFEIESGLVFDIDGDNREELILKLTGDKDHMLSVYEINPGNGKINIILSEDIKKSEDQDLDIGILEMDGDKYLYSLLDSKNDFPQTTLNLYKKIDKEIKKSDTIYKAYVDKKSYYSDKKIDKDDLPGKNKDLESKFTEIFQSLYSGSNVKLYTDGIEDKKVIEYPSNYEMDFERLVKYLFVENDPFIRKPIVRRFMLGNGIYSSNVLKISDDSRGFVRAIILGDIEGVTVTEEDENVKVIIGETTKTISDTIKDEEGNLYIPITELKDLGLIKEDKGNIIELGR